MHVIIKNNAMLHFAICFPISFIGCIETGSMDKRENRKHTYNPSKKIGYRVQGQMLIHSVIKISLCYRDSEEPKRETKVAPQKENVFSDSHECAT